MVLIVISGTYPQHKQSEVEESYLRALKKYPYDKSVMKRVLRLGVRATKDGYETISVYDIPDGKFSAAFKHYAAFMHEYANIEGYRYEIKTYLDMGEAFKILGKPVPEG
ncbi:MAG: hypothetical protein ACFFAO_01300 [Candidatus Hermodarchaeota archaeon]